MSFFEPSLAMLTHFTAFRRAVATVVSSTAVSGADVSYADAISYSDIVSETDAGFSLIKALGKIRIPPAVVLVLGILLFLGAIIAFEILRSKYVISVTHTTVPIKQLPKVFEGTRLVVLSDLHQMRFGENNEELAKIIKREEPDYILFTGDMGDSESVNVDAFYDLLESLGEDIPVIMSPGNEDLMLGGGRVHRNFLNEVKGTGAVMLNNSCAEMTFDGQKIYIYGFTQPLEPRKKAPVSTWENARIKENDVLALLGKCPVDAPVILMAHDPRPFAAYRKWGASLVLSGHMQGGLVRLPLIGGLIGPSGEIRPRYTSGLYEENGCKMYVTRGLGSSGKKVRFMNSPEVAVLTLINKTPRAPRAARQRKTAEFSVKGMMADAKQQLGATGAYFKSEGRSLRDLLDERLTQTKDFFALLFGKKRSRFAIEADEKKRRNTYVAPKKKKPANRYSGKNTRHRY